MIKPKLNCNNKLKRFYSFVNETSKYKYILLIKTQIFSKPG